MVPMTNFYACAGWWHSEGDTELLLRGDGVLDHHPADGLGGDGLDLAGSADGR